ncbi:MAG TPA: hydrogenase maturation nickel metallochaperone HypA [Geobacteraceae bacterium]|nr:hydrogenase maturation nickel metallochaperone HypA [Geobacteraceae bacterium]
MHELSITKYIVDICENSSGDSRVISVTLEIGDLSGVIPEAIEFCFEECTRNTAIEGAILRIERIEARGRCRACERVFPLRTFHDRCPACGGEGLEIVSGRDMRVKEMEVE